MKIVTKESVKTIRGATRRHLIPLSAIVHDDGSCNVVMGKDAGAEGAYVIDHEDCNDILQFFYHLRYVLGGEEGDVH